MHEIIGNLWDYHDAGTWCTITTNGTITYGRHYFQEALDPQCVMGAGVALQAKTRFPELPFSLGQLILANGNIVHELPQYHIYTFPTKTNWWKRSDIGLIIRSCKQLVNLTPHNRTVYMVRPGCGVGRLPWRDVRPKIENLLDDRFVIVELPKWQPFT